MSCIAKHILIDSKRAIGSQVPILFLALNTPPCTDVSSSAAVAISSDVSVFRLLINLQVFYLN